MNIEAIILTSSYIGIGGLMILNGFFSFPSSQVLYIIVGYFVGTGYLSLMPAALIGALGNTLGNYFLYEAVRKNGISVIKKMTMIRDHDLKKIEMVFRKKGPWFLFVAKLIPSIKVFAPIPPALGKMRRDLFLSIMFSASLVWSLIFIGIGFLFGKGATTFKTYGVILAVVALAVVYLFYRYMNSSEIIQAIADDENNDALKQ